MGVLTARARRGVSRQRVCVTLPRQAPMSRGYSSTKSPLGAGLPGCANGGSGLLGVLGLSLMIAGAVLAFGCSQDLVAIAPASATAADSGTCAKLNESCDGPNSNDRRCCEAGSWCYHGTCVSVGFDAGAGCAGLLRACNVSSDCCDNNSYISCQAVSGEFKYCASQVFTLLGGQSCKLSSDCASLHCGNDQCSQSQLCCSTAQPCKTFGNDCASPSDCCSNRCSAAGKCDRDGNCSVVGDSCESDANCCTGACFKSGNNSRCLSNNCRWEGDVCSSDSQCCTGYGFVCEGNRCVASTTQPLCQVQASGCFQGSQCCSKLCSAGANGSQTCLPADGCQPLNESCHSNAECCSGNCTPSDASGKRTCTATAACGREGEYCSPNSQCCNGSGTCSPDWYGLYRCSTVPIGPGSCQQKLEPCAFGAQCCSGRCEFDSTRGYICQNDCAENTQPCVSQSDCCRGYCSISGICSDIPTG